MFDAIAERYDLMNRLISMGVDQSWRRKTVERLALRRDGRVLDLATGTADLAILTAEVQAEAQIIGLDPSVRMLEVGREKIERRGLTARVQLQEGTAEALPFEDAVFDGITMAFGIRNVPDRCSALREMARVLVPGGRVCILELSEPRQGLLSRVARFHMHTVVPWLGARLSGAKEYRYLPQSIARFPEPQAFASMMVEAGLTVVEVIPLTFSVCHLYVATR